MIGNRRFDRRCICIFTIIGGSILFLITCFIVLYTYKMEKRIENEVQSTLQYASSQNILTIQKEIFSKRDFLRGLAHDIEKGKNFDIESNLDRFKNYVEVYGFYNMGIINKKGLCFTTLGEKWDLKDYDFYKKGMNGIGQISQSYHNEEEDLLLNIYTVPIYNGKNVEMILSASYLSDQFLDLLNILSFDGVGKSIVIDTNGRLVTIPGKLNENRDSIFKKMKSKNVSSMEQMKSNMAQLKEDYIEYSCQGEKYLGFYEPIGINDWYLMSYVPKKYMSKNINILKVDVRWMSVIIFCIFFAYLCILMIHYIRYQKKLENVVFKDPLTKDKNYEYLKMLFQTHKLAGARNCSLIALDIDNFKVINMVYGTNVGDKIIVYLHHTFKEVLPEDKLYRNRADIFVGIISHQSLFELVKKLELLNSKIQYDIKNKRICHIKISIGVCTLDEYTSLRRVYGNALIAQKNIKGNTNKFYQFFDDEMKKEFIESGQIESEFDIALQNHEFEVWYQPKYDIRKQEIIGAEALVRWRNKDKKLISPGKFIPVFEKNGQIIRLDEEIINLVFQDVKEMKRLHYKVVPISINLSRLHLYQPDAIEKIEELVKKYEIEPSQIVFEITESAVLDDKKSLQCLITRLHQLGFKVDMDDYGTGISSLGSLFSFEFDAIKLDKSFIDHIGDRKMDIIIKSTIQMAKDLNLEIIAEGTETKEQVEFLLQNDCSIAQGFYFSKPLEKLDYFTKLEKVPL